MKKPLKALIIVGILLIAIGLLGRMLTTKRIGSIALETNVTPEQVSQVAELRERADALRWITIAGAVLFIGGRVGHRLQAR